MSNRLVSFAILFVFMLCVNACSKNDHPVAESLDPVAQDLIKRAFNDNTAYALTESLTMEVGPRLAGSDGDKAAVSWGLKKLKDLGFENVHSQAVQVPKWERGETFVQIISPYKHKLVATALGGSIGTGESGIQAEVLMTESIETLEALSDHEVNGKIVFFNRRMQASKDGSGYRTAGIERRSGAQAAVKKGAVAIVIRPAGTSHHRFAHTGNMGSYDLDHPKIPAASLTNADADILEYAFRSKAATQQPVFMNLSMTSKDLGTAMSANVIGEWTGSEKPEEVILLAAHLDSWDLGTGAIDDASGIGIITAAVNLIKNAGLRPKRTLRVVYFANEEFGLSGAKEYAKQYGSKVHEHIVGLESDFGAGKIWRFASLLPENMLPLKARIFANIESLGIEMGDNESGGGADLGTMRDLGMPTFAFTQDGSQYFHYHHTADDTLDKVDADDLKQNVAVYAVAIYLMAMADDIRDQ